MNRAKMSVAVVSTQVGRCDGAQTCVLDGVHFSTAHGGMWQALLLFAWDNSTEATLSGIAVYGVALFHLFIYLFVLFFGYLRTEMNINSLHVIGL